MAGPREMTEVRVNGETYLVRAEPAGTPQGLGMASQTFTLLSLTWRRLVLRDRRWFLRVRRFDDDPTGPVLYEETAPDQASAASQLDELVGRIRAGVIPAAQP